MGSAHRGMALRLKATKTGENQWVTVRSPVAASLLRMWMAQTGPSPRVFDFTQDGYRSVFKALCENLGLCPDYVPHSLRHGGATHDHLKGMPLEDILRHGRWASTKSARHYIQAGRALLMRTTVPHTVTEMARALLRNVLVTMETALTQKHKVGAGRVNHSG